MVKTIKLQVYDVNESQVEYDNTVEGITWGVVAGSVLLDRPFMNDELKFGQVNSARLEFQLFGLDLDLTGRYIELSVEQEVPSNSHLVTDSGDNVVTDTGLLIDVSSQTTYERKTIFRGWIDSCKRDHSNVDRNVIAYDWLYFHRDDNVADLWNELWDSVLPSHQIGRIMQIFIDEYTPFVDSGIDYWGTGILVNWGMLVYSDMVPHPISYITLEQVFNMCAELMNVSPYIEPSSNTMRWAKLGTCSEDITDPKPPINVVGNVEGENSTWETYETQQITGVGIYDSESNLMQLVGTEDNVYKVVGNIFIINQPADVVTRMATNMLTELSTYTYVPCSLKLIESESITRPGQSVVSDMGNSYVMHYTLSGPSLVDEIIDAYAKSPYLNKDVQSNNQEFITAYKISKVEQTVDGIETEIADLKDGSSTTISQLANAVIVRLKSNGQFAEAKLIDDGTGGTEFKVTADNIDFIANNTMQLTAKNLGITSTNFSVTPTGAMTANLGNIAGWIINANNIYKEVTASGVTYATTLSSSVAAGANGFAFSISRTESGTTTYPLVIRNSGKLECSNIAATGDIVCKNLKATDSIKLTSSFNRDFTFVWCGGDTESYFTRLYNGRDQARITFIDYDAGDWNGYAGYFTGGIWRFQTMLEVANHLTVTEKVNVEARTSSGNAGLEIYGTSPYIDFHNSLDTTTDYTARIIHITSGNNKYIDFWASSSAWITCRALSFANQSSKHVKKNIKDITDDEAKKLLQLRPVSFDYKFGDVTNQRGLIAEEVAEIMPEMVIGEIGEFEEYTPYNTPSIDYSKFVPYLIKMIQIQQKEIDSIVIE